MPAKKSDESKLAKIKKDYKKFQEKYSLPTFEKLNEDFQIEKVSESETDFPLREIRKVIADRIFNYLRNVEALINPSNSPMFVFSIVKNMNPEDKKKLTEIYKELAKKEVEIFKIDVHYSEKTEADFIKNVFTLWQKIKKELLEVFNSIEDNWDTKAENGNRKYFG